MSPLTHSAASAERAEPITGHEQTTETLGREPDDILTPRQSSQATAGQEPGIQATAGQDPGSQAADRSEPEWLQILRRACARSSQARVARDLRQSDGYPSAPLIGLVLSGKYPSSTERLEALVKGIFQGITVDCPVLGDLRLDDCLDHQNRPYSSASILRVQMYRACRGCPQRHAEER